MRNMLSNLKTVLCSLLLLAWAGSVQAQSVVVDFVPTPLNSIVNEGDNFAVTIEVQANGQATAGAEIHLDFDPTYLEVVSFTSGTTLPIPIIGPLSDNVAGTIDYAAGTFSTSPPTGTFALLTINFLAKAVVSSTSVTYNTVFPRATAASTGGNPVLDEAIPFTVTINGLCNLATSGLSNIQCNDNGTPSDPSDDYFTFDLNPTGTNLGAGYSVSGVVGAGTGSYNGVSSFATATGTAGTGDLNITITDNSAGSCTLAETVTDPGTCANSAPLTLIIGNEDQFACGNILIPVTVENYTGVAGGSGAITWDDAVLNLVGTQQYDPNSGLSVGSFFSPGSGQLNFAYISGSGAGQNITDGQVLFVLEFTVVGPAGSSSSIVFDGAVGPLLAFLDDNIPTPNQLPATFVDGLVEVPSSTSLIGEAFSELGNSISGVTFDLSGDDGPVTQVGTPGYDFPITPCAADEIGASKSNDLDTDNGVNVFDLLLIQRDVLSIVPLSSPYKLIAADVDGSGAVNVFDLFLTQQMVLQLRSKFPTPGGSTAIGDGTELWTFIPSDWVFADPTDPWPFESRRIYSEVQPATNQNFIGMKLGDVDNSWNPSVLRIAPVGQVNFEMPVVEGMPGSDVVIPVKVSDFNDVAGFQFTMSWDPNVLSLMGVDNREIAAEFGQQSIQNGNLTVVWHDQAGQGITLADGSVVFDLHFRLQNTWGTQASVEITSNMTPIDAANGSLQRISIGSTSGQVNISATTGIDPLLNEGYGLFQNMPNPFEESTVLLFELPRTEEVEIQILNALGQHVRTFNGTYSAGVHDLKWDGTGETGMEVSEGIYYARMKAGSFSGSVRMHKLK